MSSLPLIYADFHNADPQGRVRLNCVGTVNDLSLQQVQLREGLKLRLYADDANEQGQENRLIADGVVAYSSEEKCWVAVIDWDKIRHESQTAPLLEGKSGNQAVPTVLPGANGKSSPTRPAAR